MAVPELPEPRQSTRHAGLWQDIVSSVRAIPNQDTPRNRLLRVSQTVWLHLHPAKVPRHALRLRYTLGAGGITFFLFLVTIGTGVVLMLFYRPTPEHAYMDMKSLDFDVPFGMFQRNMHRWAAHAMVIMAWIHMARVFLTGSYRRPRQFNWTIGVFLLVTTLLLSFTGYLLPWDQLALWAVTVGTNMAAATPLIGHEGPFAEASGVTAESDVRAALLGGSEVGAAALLRFYVLHCFLLPLLLCVGLVLHFWRVRKDGGISGPRRTRPRSQP
jgi:quinol-cytochrome oxidoreductase complex cytochrome b subunit